MAYAITVLAQLGCNGDQQAIEALAALATPTTTTPSANSSTERSRRCRARKKGLATPDATAPATANATPVQRVAATPVQRVAATYVAPSLSSPDLGAEKEAIEKGIQDLSFHLSSENAHENVVGNAGATRCSNAGATRCSNAGATPAATVTATVTATPAQRVARRLRSTDERATDKRAAPIPTSWQPTDEHRAFAKLHGIDIATEVFSFRGFFEGQAVKSPNGRFATWLGNAANRRRERGPTVTNGRAVDGPRGEAYRVQQPPPKELA